MAIRYLCPACRGSGYWLSAGSLSAHPPGSMVDPIDQPHPAQLELERLRAINARKMPAEIERLEPKSRSFAPRSRGCGRCGMRRYALTPTSERMGFSPGKRCSRW